MEEKKKRLAFNEAANKSFEYLKKIIPDAARPELEEVELSDDDKYWFITLSFDGSVAPPPNTFSFLTKSRLYKIFKVDAYTGEIRSMKIRDI